MSVQKIKKKLVTLATILLFTLYNFVKYLDAITESCDIVQEVFGVPALVLVSSALSVGSF